MEQIGSSAGPRHSLASFRSHGCRLQGTLLEAERLALKEVSHDSFLPSTVLNLAICMNDKQGK